MPVKSTPHCGAVEPTDRLTPTSVEAFSPNTDKQTELNISQSNYTLCNFWKCAGQYKAVCVFFDIFTGRHTGMPSSSTKRSLNLTQLRKNKRKHADKTSGRVKDVDVLLSGDRDHVTYAGSM